MRDGNEAVGWRHLREFAGVDVEHSYVLSWTFERNTLFIDVDVQLRAEHPFYEMPRRRGRACVRAAVIEFPYCTGLRLDGADPQTDIATLASKLGTGVITGLARRDEGPYLLSGEFGTVEIEAERPLLRLQTH